MSEFIEYQLLKVSCWMCLFKKEKFKRWWFSGRINFTCSPLNTAAWRKSPFAFLSPQTSGCWLPDYSRSLFATQPATPVFQRRCWNSFSRRDVEVFWKGFHIQLAFINLLQNIFLCFLFSHVSFWKGKHLFFTAKILDLLINVNWITY